MTAVAASLDLRRTDERGDGVIRSKQFYFNFYNYDESYVEYFGGRAVTG